MRLTREGRQRLEKKRIRKKEINKKVMPVVALLTLVSPLSINATTVEDIRYLVGSKRLSDVYTQQEIANIKIGYKKIESFNNIVDMFELLKDVDKDIILMTRKERASLISKINIKKYELENTFSYGGSVNDVLKVKSELDNMIFKESLLKKENEVIKLKKQKNVYDKDYKTIEKIEKEVESYKELGILPYEIGFPVVNSTFLVGAYGVYKNGGTKYFNNGIDIYGIEGQNVINMFHGVVEKVEFLNDGVYRIVIKNDKDLKTVYESKMVVSKDIKEGVKVKQREVLGTLKNTDEGFGYLHFEVYVDNKTVNPIYLFGDVGKNALKTYQSIVEDEFYQDYSYVIEKIKSNVDNQEMKKENVNKQVTEKEGTIPLYIDKLYEAPNPVVDIKDE